MNIYQLISRKFFQLRRTNVYFMISISLLPLRRGSQKMFYPNFLYFMLHTTERYRNFSPLRTFKVVKLLIRDFNQVLSLGDKLLGLRVYVPCEPCDRIGFISKVTDNSIIYKYFYVQRKYERFLKSSGRINCDNFQHCVIENLRSILVDEYLKSKDKSCE